MNKIKKILSVFITTVLICTVFTACTYEKGGYSTIDKANTDSVTTISFNCAAPWGNVLKGTGSGTRVKKFADYMNTVKPDTIGTQEMNSKWLSKLETLMSDYESYGVKRGGDDNESKSEMNAVFWLKDKYTCEDKNTFWLSTTPETESKYEGAGCYRVCTYVVLKSNETGSLLIHMNTHLDNASEEAANYGAEVISQKIDELKGQYSDAAIVLTGDFNETAGMIAYNTISEKLTDAKTLVPAAETKETYHGWGDITEGEPIDHIFITTGKNAVNYKILDNISNGYISDHNGVYIEWTPFN